MNIRQLEAFIQIVDGGSFAAAAEQLHLTQSTISARIKELEAFFGVSLFVRSRMQKAELTPKGHDLLEGARQLVSFAQYLQHQISDKEKLTGLFRLGVAGHLAATSMPQAVSRIRAEYPGIKLALHVDLTDNLLELLRARKLDAAIVAGLPTEEYLNCTPLGKDKFVWMASPALDIPKKDIVPSELLAWPILSFSEKSHHYPVIRQWFAQARTPFSATVSSNNMELLARLAMLGEGVALLPRSRYTKEVAAGALEEINTKPASPDVDFYFVYPHDAGDRATWFSRSVLDVCVSVIGAGRSHAAQTEHHPKPSHPNTCR